MQGLLRVSRQHFCLLQLRAHNVIQRGFATAADTPLRLSSSTPDPRSKETPRNPPRLKRKRSFWRKLLGTEGEMIDEGIPKPEPKEDAVAPLSETTRGPLRPMIGAKKVNEEHPLYAFFRQTKRRSYTILEAPDDQDESSRSWSATELRRKSFSDLHTLWYVLARERNLLATQVQTARRLGLDPKVHTSTIEKDIKCRKSMARIKQVMNERRLAYLDAVEIVSKGDSASAPVTDTASSSSTAKAT